ncbi:MAG: endonuclease/exonuclease/phosphatase family protein [Muribaculaceae bacterium]|nr:endonuclease/exonuclease/phosphatase family protein [Muribaculaceae bacterium]
MLAAIGSILTSAHAAGDGDVKVLQWNIWQEGTMVAGGAEAIADEIARLEPDFVTLSEVRNYGGRDYTASLVKALADRGKEYHSFRSYDSGLLSKYPITDSLVVFPEKDDHGSIYRLTAAKDEREFAVYTAHLDYRDCAYYNVRGYDGSTWKEIEPDTDSVRVMRRNDASQRDDAIRAFLDCASRDVAEGRVVILGGDFNEPSHLDWTQATAHMFDHHGLVLPWTVTSLLDKAGYVDTYRTLYPDPVTHPGFTYPSDCPSIPPSKVTWAPKSDERERIDYIFLSPDSGLEVKDADIFGPRGSVVRSRVWDEIGLDRFVEPLDVWPTDHKGVLVTLAPAS